MFSCWCSQRVSYHAGSVKTILGLSLHLSHSSSAGGVFLCMFYGSWTAALTTTCSATFPARGWKGAGGTLISQGDNRTMEKIAKPYSPLCCPPVCTASSCVPCHWTSAGRTSANPSCHNGLVWQQLWSWCARLSRPPTTDTCLRWEETSLQLLQTDVNIKKKTPFIDKWCIRCPCRLDEMK